MDANTNTEKRIINVSNRLPVRITVEQGKKVFQPSEGGLATGLSSVFASYRNIWIGWPGAPVKEAEQQSVIEDLEGKSLSPVFLSEQEITSYYEGFSNETLWPLFHYFPTYSKYSQEHWESYVSVNRKFADEIIRLAGPDDIVWIHDYQLMMVPQMVRQALPDITVGYFQHIPFPDYEIFRALPWKRELITGLLGADTIGFQTDDDARHFINTAARILGITADYGQLNIDGRNVSVGAFPISIDFNKFRELANHEETNRNACDISRMIGTKLAISVDRLDYSKGILHRLQAFDLFLQKHPEWLSKITLFHLVVPSRDNVGCYKDLKEEMNRLISNINGRYATLGWQPIHHFYQSFPPCMLAALYKTADLALVTPLRDGMNLVSKEYVAGNIDMNGMLILSEAAGAARELTDALIINPNDINGYADAIYEGLNMPAKERQKRMSRMRDKIRTSDIFCWANSFLQKLKNTVNRQRVKVCMPVNHETMEHIARKYGRSHRRLLLLDYDGTLMPFFNKAQDALPDHELLKLIEKMAADRRNNIVVISGRDRHTLEQWLGHLRIDLVGEHGAWFKEYGKPWRSAKGLTTQWKKEVGDTMENYTLMVPGATVEEKFYSIAWHYRGVDVVLGAEKAGEMMNYLKEQLAGKGLDVIQGNKVIEVRSSLVNKGKAALELVGREPYDFIMAIGDDRTDEDMFKALPEQSFTIKVGSNISAATYCQKSYMEVRTLLNRLQCEETMVALVLPLIINKAS